MYLGTRYALFAKIGERSKKRFGKFDLNYNENKIFFAFEVVAYQDLIIVHCSLLLMCYDDLKFYSETMLESI